MRARLVAALAAAALVTTLGACSGAADPASDDSASGPISLDFWSWGDLNPELVKVWNAANPDVQVKLTDAGGGTDSSAKLLTAIRAGEAPDLAMVEFNTLPSMIVGGVAADITEYMDPVMDQYTDAIWGLTRFNDAIYGVPQDIGPQALIYNKARFAELGVTEAPVTWADFATAAQTIRAADPESYITSFAPAEFGGFAGWAQQAGAEWWSVDGEDWTVGIDSPQSLEVADYWQDLLTRDLVTPAPLLTPEWNKAVNDGKILAWPAAVWAPDVIYGVAEATAGDWALAPLPQWTPGDAKVAYQGGSATVVTEDSKHAAAAAEFAIWLNSSKEATALQVASGQYPASLTGQGQTKGSKPPALMAQQADYWDVVSEIAANTIPEISWGPNVNVASSAFQDAAAAAINNGTPLREALVETQRVVVEDMKTTGFKVSE